MAFIGGGSPLELENNTLLNSINTKLDSLIIKNITIEKYKLLLKKLSENINFYMSNIVNNKNDQKDYIWGCLISRYDEFKNEIKELIKINDLKQIKEEFIKLYFGKKIFIFCDYNSLEKYFEHKEDKLNVYTYLYENEYIIKQLI